MKTLHLTNDLDGLSIGLTSPDPVARIMARGIATGFPDLVERWMGEEVNRDESKIGDVLQALARLQLQLYASVVAGTLDRGGDEAAAKAYCMMAQSTIAEHAELVRQHGSGVAA